MRREGFDEGVDFSTVILGDKKGRRISSAAFVRMIA
jgi:hypothetical protein